MATSPQRPFFGGHLILSLLFQPLYNGNFSTTATSLQWPLSAVHKVAIVERFNYSKLKYIFRAPKPFPVEATCPQWKEATPPNSPSKFFPHLSIFPDVYNLPKLVSSFSDTKIKEAKASK